MQTTLLAQQFVPLMFLALFTILLTGFPVAFGLAATGLALGFIGIEAGIFPAALFQALPLRIFGIMQNDTLLAIPFSRSWGLFWSAPAWQRTCWKRSDRYLVPCVVALPSLSSWSAPC